MLEPGTGEGNLKSEKQPMARNLVPEQKDGFQRQLRGILDSGESAVNETKFMADRFADDQWENVAYPLHRFDRLAGIFASGVIDTVKRESNRVYGSKLKDAWESMADTAHAGVRELLRDDLERTEVEGVASEALSRISNRGSVVNEVFPDVKKLIVEVNSGLRYAQKRVLDIPLDAPDIADQAEQLRDFKKELSKLLDRNDPKLAEGRQFTEKRCQKIMDIVGEIRKLVDAIAETRLVRS